ncbi:hypothetical protein SUDANB1_07117 [Streptomyces sp. enrichment culture]|uniref:hypothetical protein n=1 Tax=Streptomyces sp. enrichment culture TaxID=1795815 RepID=UPI003F578616
MTREQVDAVTETGLWLHEQVATYGPGLALAAAGIAVSWTCSKIRDWRERRRELRDQLRPERQQMSAVSHAIDTAPLIPTQPGRDDQLLNACEAAWTADEPRKETP